MLTKVYYALKELQFMKDIQYGHKASFTINVYGQYLKICYPVVQKAVDFSPPTLN